MEAQSHLLSSSGSAVLLPRSWSSAIVLGAAIPLVAYLGLVLLLRARRGAKLPPGRMGLPFIGEMPAYVKGPLDFHLERSRTYGTPFLTHIFFVPTVTLSDDDDIKWLFDLDRKGFVEPQISPNIHRLLGRNTIINSFGSRHKFLRRLMGPAFLFQSIREYVDVIDRTTRKELEKWASQGEFVSSTVFKKFALRLLFSCVFPGVGEEVLQKIHNDIRIWFEGFQTIFPFPLPGTTLSRSLAARERLLQSIGRLVDNFKAEHPEESEGAKTTLLGKMCYGTDSEGKRLGDEELRDNILIILFGGHDTTQATLGSLLHNLSKADQRVTDALFDEVSADKFAGPALDFDELKNAPVLNAVIAENWRKDPPFVQSPQKLVNREVTYKGWKFPKGTVFNYSIGLPHYNERIYPQPPEFRIERYLPMDHPLVVDSKDNCGNLHTDVDYNKESTAFLTFGGGNHYCLGGHFARLEMRIFLARLFQRYDVEVRNCKKINFFFNTYELEFRLTPR